MISLYISADLTASQHDAGVLLPIWMYYQLVAIAGMVHYVEFFTR